LKKLFNELQKQLCSVYEEPPTGNDLKRIKTLSGLVSGMIRKNSSYLADIGSGLPQIINAHSKEIAAKRFLENKWVDYDYYYLPFLKQFLPAIIGFTPYWQDKLVLVIDGSQTGKHHATLMISLYWQGRGIPICWFVKKGGKGHFSEQNHVDLLEHAASIIRPILPDHMSVVLLGDGEFDGVKLQKSCLNQKWDYVFRTACDSVLYENDERFTARQALPTDETDVLFIPNVEFTEKRLATNFICWFDRKKYDDPIFLVSSLGDVIDVVDFYDQRYSIECLFKDLKSTSFNLHKTRIKDAAAISNLIIVAAIAFIMLITLGLHFQHHDVRARVQRIRKDQKVLSLFSYACKLLQYLLEHGLSLNFSFQFSKNLSNSFIRGS